MSLRWRGELVLPMHELGQSIIRGAYWNRVRGVPLDRCDAPAGVLATISKDLAAPPGTDDEPFGKVLDGYDVVAHLNLAS